MYNFFHFQNWCLFILNCLFFIQNKIQVIILMTLRENSISFTAGFFSK